MAASDDTPRMIGIIDEQELLAMLEGAYLAGACSLLIQGRPEEIPGRALEYAADHIRGRCYPVESGPTTP